MYGSGVPDPVSVTRSKLYANPWSLGAFHAIHVGVNSTDLENFSEPVNNLKFAGSYISPAFSLLETYQYLY